LEKKHNKIVELLDKGVSKAEIARLMGCSWVTFIDTLGANFEYKKETPA